MEQLEVPYIETVLRDVAEWAKDKNTEAHWLAAARYAFRWGLGRQVSEVVYDAALVAVQSISLR